ncbi:hypothetical protein HYALB_00009338 [Hymenoscyphus albidus]|uniref:C2H2-type domain-containing protein n=1 Tax=Hymenoscyphus albidus TaxID=595503 RepID=A0A9N9Q710_9HELO|nr:hypothetical protein HYALB_00009338 [Hymenoscyphus albidus]
MVEQTSRTRWARSDPTMVSRSINLFTCTFESKGKSCMKTFSRQCDLRRHHKNHTRPAQCQKCTKRFPSPKDLERHNNSVHDHAIKYFCTQDWCRDSAQLEGPDSQAWFDSGFSRKDHWQKHMKDDHNASRDFMRDLWKNGTLIARQVDGKWNPVFPKVFYRKLLLTRSDSEAPLG